MAAKNVTNNGTTALGLPSGEVIAAKSTALVKDFSMSENSDVVKAWVKAGLLTVSAARAEKEADQPAQAPEARIAGTELDETKPEGDVAETQRAIHGDGAAQVGDVEGNAPNTVDQPVDPAARTVEADVTQDAREEPEVKKAKKDKK